MYVWIWRHLPGGRAGRFAGTFVLLLAALALLFFIVFPWAEPRLPFNNVTVEGNDSGSPAPASPAPATPMTSPGP